MEPLSLQNSHSQYQANETEFWQEMSKSLFCEALERMNPRDCYEYKQALSEAPELVHSESKFVHFLRTEQFQVTRAAQRLCRYWKYRKLIFGDRWLLPLNQTGRGALNVRDLEILRSGYALVQPRPWPQGPLLIVDISRLTQTADFSDTRCMYYLCCAFPEEFSHPDGVTVISITTTAPRNPLSVDRDTMLFVLTGLPFRVKKTLMTQTCNQPGKEILVETMAQQHKRIVEFKAGLNFAILPTLSVADTFRALAKHGVQREYIPCTIGGTYDYTSYDEWVGKRLSLEDIMGAAPLCLNQILHNPPETAHLPPTLAITKRAKIAVQNKQRMAAKNNTNNLIVQKRINTYQRRNITLAQLQEQVAKLEAQSDSIRKDNRRLEGFLAQARLIVACVEYQPETYS